MGPSHYIIIASSPLQLSAAHNTTAVLKVHDSQRYISDPLIWNETRRDGSSISGCCRSFFPFFFLRFFFIFYSTFILWSSLGIRCPPHDFFFLLAQRLLRSLRLVLHAIHTPAAHINTPRALLCSCSRCACPSPFLNPHPRNKFHPLAVWFLLLGLFWMVAATFSLHFLCCFIALLPKRSQTLSHTALPTRNSGGAKTKLRSS